jgi:polysaccharide export outer membrane protein
MKQSSDLRRRSIASSLLLLAGLFLAGCQHQFYADPYSSTPVSAPGFDLTKPVPQPSPSFTAQPVAPPVFVSPPADPPPVTPAVAPVPVSVPPVPIATGVPVTPPVVSPPPSAVGPVAPPPSVTAVGATIVQVGDLLTVSFSDLPPNAPLQDFKGRVGEDGNITLPYNITVKVSGKTPGQLQKEIRDAYVPRLYINLTVTVKTEDRFFFVGGEVRNPNRFPYFAQITVLRSIQAAGDFTDFALRKKVQLIRANGQKHIINCVEALKKPDLDLQVFPGDTINVPRRIGIFGL